MGWIHAGTNGRGPKPTCAVCGFVGGVKEYARDGHRFWTLCDTCAREHDPEMRRLAEKAQAAADAALSEWDRATPVLETAYREVELPVDEDRPGGEWHWVPIAEWADADRARSVKPGTAQTGQYAWAFSVR